MQISAIESFVMSKWPAAVVDERTEKMISFDIAQLELDEAFDALEAQRAALGVADFTIGEGTLENAFTRLCHQHEQQRV